MNQVEKRKISFVFFTSSIYALGIVTYFLLSYFYPIDFIIPKGEIPLIGEASKNNISVGSRVGSFYQFVFIGLLFWIGITWLFQRIYNTYFSSVKSYSSGLYFMIPLLTFAYMLVLGSDVTQVINLLLGIFIINLVRKIILSRNSVAQNRVLFSLSFELSLGLSFLSYIFLYFFLGHLDWVEESSVTLLLGLLILFQVVSFIVGNSIKDKHLQLILLSFSGVPFLAFIAVEFHVYSLEKNLYLVGYEIIYTLLMLLWVLVGWMIVRRSFWSFKTIQTKIFTASMLFGFSLLAFYQPIIMANEELFELANPANSLLRIMKFGEIPILDFMSSHMLYEQWYGIIYQSFFGFKDSVDFTIYAFLNLFIYLFIIYWILIRVGFKAGVALVFVFFFPIIHQLFFAPVIYVFLILFSIQKVTASPSAKNFFLLLVLLFLLVIWRIDTGVIAIFSTAIFLPIYWWLSQKSFPIMKLFKAFGFFALLLAVLGTIAIILRPLDELWSNFLSTLHYVKGSQAHGYSQIFDGTYHQFYLFHVLFVLIALALSVIAIIKIRGRVRLTNDIKVNSWLIFSLFSFIIFIANAQRGLVRHGFGEGSDLFYTCTFFLGLAFFIVDLFRDKIRAQQFAIFFSVLFFSFIGTKYFPFFPEKLNTTHLLNSTSLSNLDSLLAKENYKGRVENHETFKKHVFGDIKRYMNNHLTPKASFIDFSNTPMLYYYCERNVPGYFNQNLQNTIDNYLQFQLINAYEKKKLPITVYSSYPRNWFDETDGILNTVRYYWIAEYIYENYKPLGVLNNKSIWGEKTSSFEEIPQKDTLINQPINLDLGYLAGWQGNYFEQKHLTNQSFTKLLEKELVPFDKSNLQTVFIGKDAVQNNHVELILKVHPDANYYLNEIQSEIAVRDTLGNIKHHVTIKRADKQFTYYAIRLSNHYFWHQNEPLILEFPEIVGIEKVMIIKDNRNEH